MPMVKFTSMHHATGLRLAVFVAGDDDGSTNFAVFKYGDDNEYVSVMLTPEDTERLARQFTDAVARFRACGALPAVEPAPVEQEARAC